VTFIKKTARFGRRRCTAIASLAAFVVFILFFGQDLLRFGAEMLVVNEDSQGFDHALLLGGDKRFAVASDLFAHDKLQQVLLFEDKGSNLVRFGVLRAGHELAQDALAERGVPHHAIVVIERHVGLSVFDDLGKWMRQNETARICVFTDQFGTRRTRYLFDLTLTAAQAARVRVVGLRDRRYDETNWWKGPDGVKAFVNSTLDLAHTWCVGREDNSRNERWDPIEYERQLRATVMGRK
jgi:hypothetical protein